MIFYAQQMFEFEFDMQAFWYLIKASCSTAGETCEFEKA